MKEQALSRIEELPSPPLRSGRMMSCCGSWRDCDAIIAPVKPAGPGNLGLAGANSAQSGTGH